MNATKFSRWVSTTKEYVIVLMAAGLLVAAVDAFTNQTPPRWDALQYVDMAENGIRGNEHLAAPFAYRPGMPMLAGWLSRTAGLSVDRSFQLVGYAFMLVTLVCTYGIARCYIKSKGLAFIPVLLVGLSAGQLKFPLFFYSLVDVGGYAFMAAAFWALLRGKNMLGLVVAAVGLLFKEFLAAALLMALLGLWSDHQKERTRQTLAYLLIGLATGTAFVVLPRVYIPIEVSVQEIDPINHPRSLVKLITHPLDLRRDLNILYSFAMVWMPSLVLIGRERGKWVWQELGGQRVKLAAGLAVIGLLTMYGGQNIPIFASYSFAVQLVVIALLLERGITSFEIIYLLAAMLVVNKIFLPIPLPEENLKDYLEFYGGYDSQVTLATLKQLALMGALVLGGWVLRRTAARSGSTAGS